MAIHGSRPVLWPWHSASRSSPPARDLASPRRRNRGKPVQSRRSRQPGRPGLMRARSPRAPQKPPHEPRPPTPLPPCLSKDDEARRKRSPFLLPPGSSPADRYDPDIESTDPPWRQTAFFGIRARGQFFIYVLDQSGSMIDDDRLTRAKIELRRSVFALQPPQRFEVIFYNDQATPMPGGPLPRPADPQSKNQLMTWLRLIDPDGETNPKSAIAQALALRPDAVFLLSDGEFPEGTVEAVARLNSRKVPIHCVDLTGGQAGDHLQRIARDSGGKYASRPGSLQGGP